MMNYFFVGLIVGMPLGALAYIIAQAFINMIDWGDW